MKNLGQRLQIVGLIPTALAASLIALFLVGDAPERPLNLATITDVVHRVGVAGGFLLLFVSAAVSVTLQPLQFRLVQLYEGYWSSRLFAVPFRIGVWRQSRRVERLMERTKTVVGPDGSETRREAERRNRAEQDLLTRFPSPDRLLPTALGNVLRAKEDSADDQRNLPRHDH